MMRFSLASATLVSAEMSWSEWKDVYGKVYNGNEEETMRQQIFEKNVESIEAHNAQGNTWTMALNVFGDRTHDEFVELVSGKNKTFENLEGTLDLQVPEAALPSSVDWVAQGIFNPVRDQGDSSSCWAHSAVGVLESNYALATGSLPMLSEQQLCDCSNAGSCDNGGEEDDAIAWYENHKACSRESYHYRGTDGTCKESSCETAVPKGAVTGQTWVKENPDALKSALAGRPVTASVWASGLSQFYSSGVITGSGGNVVDGGCSGSVNHAVIAVGYGTDNGEAYFKIRNSWGRSWGEGGYVRLGASSSSQYGNACLFRWPGSYPQISGSAPPAPSPPSGCSDFANWMDQESETCDDFVYSDWCTSSGGTGSGWDSSYGKVTDWHDRSGNTAFDACCGCGGGSKTVVV